MLFRKNSYREKGWFKCFIGYINEINAFPVPLYIKLPQMKGMSNILDKANV